MKFVGKTWEFLALAQRLRALVWSLSYHLLISVRLGVSIILDLPQDSCSHPLTEMPMEKVHFPPVGSWKRLKIHRELSKTLTLRRFLPSKQSPEKRGAERELWKTSFSWLVSLFESRGQSRCPSPITHGTHEWQDSEPSEVCGGWARACACKCVSSVLVLRAAFSILQSPLLPFPVKLLFQCQYSFPPWCLLMLVPYTFIVTIKFIVGRAFPEARALSSSMFTSWPCGYLIVL